MGHLRRSVLLLTSGTATGQLILFISSLVIARLFSPLELGSFTTLSALAAILAVVASGRFELAIPIPADHSSGIALGKLALTASLLCSLTLAVVTVAIDGSPTPEWLDPAFAHYWAVPALTFSLAAFQIGNQLAVRAEQYRSLAIRSLAYPAVAGGLQVVAGLGNSGEGGLVAAVAIGQLAAFVVTWLPSHRSLQRKAASQYIDLSWLTLSKKYWTFPVLLSPSGALNVLCSQSPLLIVAALYGLSQAGQYGLAMKLLAVPVALMGQAVGYVYTGEISRARREGHRAASELYKIASQRLSLVGLALLIGLAIGAPSGIPLLLGSRWADAGIFAQLMSLGLAAQLLAAPLSQTMTIAGRQWGQLAIDAWRLCLLVGCAMAAHRLEWGASATVAAISMASALGYILMWTANAQAARAIDARWLS